MSKEVLQKAKALFQHELQQVNNAGYPLLPSANAGLVVLYAKLVEIEKRLEQLSAKESKENSFAGRTV